MYIIYMIGSHVPEPLNNKWVERTLLKTGHNGVKKRIFAQGFCEYLGKGGTNEE